MGWLDNNDGTRSEFTADIAGFEYEIEAADDDLEEGKFLLGISFPGAVSCNEEHYFETMQEAKDFARDHYIGELKSIKLAVEKALDELESGTE